MVAGGGDDGGAWRSSKGEKKTTSQVEIGSQQEVDQPLGFGS